MRTRRTREVGDRDRRRVYMKPNVARDAEREKRKERRQQQQSVGRHLILDKKREQQSSNKEKEQGTRETKEEDKE